MAAPEKKKTSMGMDQNVESGLCYIAGFITGLIFFFSEKENKTVRFHGLQSIGLTALLIAVLIVGTLFTVIFSFISITLAFIWGVLLTIVYIGWVVLWLIVMIRAFMGATMRLPLIAGICDKLNK